MATSSEIAAITTIHCRNLFSFTCVTSFHRESVAVEAG